MSHLIMSCRPHKFKTNVWISAEFVMTFRASLIPGTFQSVSFKQTAEQNPLKNDKLILYLLRVIDDNIRDRLSISCDQTMSGMLY